MADKLPIPWNLMKPGAAKGGINIIFAGAGFNYDLAYSVGVRKRLLSWAANTEDEVNEYEDNQRVGKVSFGIIDSGAFTVWRTGETLDVTEYADCLTDLLDFFSIAANVDVIPGKRGTAASDISRQQIEDAAARGWANYEYLLNYLQGAGIDSINRVMPIYHQGEHIDWLKRMLNRGCTYVGISPSNDYQTSQRMFWLDEVFKYLEQFPDVKTHGYGVNSPRLMESYNWYSVDAASWINMGAYGMVLTPYGIIKLSDREEAKADSSAYQSIDWSPEMMDTVGKYFTEIGFTTDELRADYRKRWQATAIHLLKYEANYKFKPKMQNHQLIKHAMGSIEPPPSLDLAEGQFLGEIPMSLFESNGATV